jgi:UDP-N-acetyl-D-galactosamine dehydrogenase
VAEQWELYYTRTMTPRSIAIIGLGYVGLPLAHAFAKKGYEVIGFDISERRVEELKRNTDSTLELTTDQLKEVTINYGTDPKILEQADVIILAIPTPIDDQNNPDLTPVIKASETVGKHLKKGAIVVYESTVYPGVTEEMCGPILEKQSGFKCGTDFTLAYSPERINPGDKEHTVTKILKIVSGQDQKTLDTVAELYGSVITAGVHRAPSIKVAEMAKAIENAQRDINIAFVNEVAMLCNKIGIETKDVLEAAGTKWNFLRFTPGLVGGHCIGVDPYYLVEKAKQLGMQTHVITAGRGVNDGMPAYIADRIENALKGKQKPRILVLGLTFKEDIPDTRNSKAQCVVKELMKKGFAVEAHDPFLDEERVKKLGFVPGSLDKGPYDAVLLLVTHKQYLRDTTMLTKALKEDGVLFDLKSVLQQNSPKNRTYISL